MMTTSIVTVSSSTRVKPASLPARPTGRDGATRAFEQRLGRSFTRTFLQLGPTPIRPNTHADSVPCRSACHHSMAHILRCFGLGPYRTAIGRFARCVADFKQLLDCVGVAVIATSTPWHFV